MFSLLLGDVVMNSDAKVKAGVGLKGLLCEGSVAKTSRPYKILRPE
jgi:hypothetical protein